MTSAQHSRERRTFLTAIGASSLLAGCIWPRLFDLSWNEELQLHDGRVLVAKFSYRYERQGGLTFDRYDPAIFREATLTFDAGPPLGVVSQVFIHHRPELLDTFNGEWFTVLQGRAGSGDQEWGSAQNGNGQRTARLVGNSFKPTPISQLPTWMSAANILMDYAPKRELAALDGTLVTLEHKAIYSKKYPLSPIDRRIERP